MKIKLPCILILFGSQFCFSQTIKGKIVCNDFAVPKVEVINATTKILSNSDENGNFSIVAKPNDELVFVSKMHQIKQLILTPDFINKGDLTVFLALKAEELKEVVITSLPSIRLSSDTKYEQGKLDQMALEAKASKPQIVGQENPMPNGPNIFRILGMVVGLFVKEKEKEIPKKIVPTVSFKDFAKSNCDSNYFTETLKLDPTEIGLFLEFCEADNDSKEIVDSKNVLSLMDFLFKKSEGFKKGL